MKDAVNRHVAIREASHAVIAWALCNGGRALPFIYVLATTYSHNDGRVTNAHTRSRRSISTEYYATIALAGSIAVAQVLKTSYTASLLHCGLRDWNAAKLELFIAYGYDHETLRREMYRLEIEARALVRDYKPAIRALADALMVKP